MLETSQMVYRLIVSIILGGIMGLERESIGKEAGVRTAMLVAAGSTLYTIISLEIPYIFGLDPTHLSILSDRVISNIVVGVGFLGAGIIIKTGEHVRGLTTSAVVWATAAIGVLVGVGLMEFALVSTVIMAGLLYILRKGKLFEYVRPEHRRKRDEENGDSV